MVDMIYRDGKRFYIIDGEEMPSVNTVLGVLGESPRLQDWKDRTQNWREIQQYRALQGNVIHYQVASDVARRYEFPPPELPLRIDEKMLLRQIMQDKQKKTRFNEEVKLAIAMFKDWEIEYQPEWLAVEKVVYSKEIRFAGTLDGYAIIKDLYWLIDIKSNPYLWDKYEYQLNGYRIGMEEMGFRVDKTGLLNIVPTLRTQEGYKFTEIGNFTREFKKIRYKFTRHHAI